MINYGKQYIDASDIKSVTKVLKGEWLTQGPQVVKFEYAIKNFFRAKYCAVVSSGTAALHLVGIALGWKKGDIILTTPISFLATSNSILYSGAKPVFVDIEKKYFTIDAKKLEEKIKYYKSKKKKVAAIIATDYAGHPCDWKKIKELGKKYKIKLINDNCHAIGTTYKNDRSYALKFADIVTHSYHPLKNITTAEGGSVLTNNKKINEKIKILRSHGVEKKFSEKPWSYKMVKLGYNYRISDLHCALGISQLKKLGKFLKKRRQVAKIYNQAFKGIKNIKVPEVRKNIQHAYHLYPLRVDFSKFKISKELFFKKLKKRKINLQVHYIPIHLQPYYKKNFKYKKGDFPVAEKFYLEEVSLPIYYSLKNIEINYLIREIKKLLMVN